MIEQVHLELPTIQSLKLANTYLKDSLVEFSQGTYFVVVVGLCIQENIAVVDGIGLLFVMDALRFVQLCYDECIKQKSIYVMEIAVQLVAKISLILMIVFSQQSYTLLIAFSVIGLILRILIYYGSVLVESSEVLQQFAAVMCKMLVLIDTTMITLKLDGYLDWEWLEILWLQLITIALVFLILVALVTYFLMNLISLIFHDDAVNTNKFPFLIHLIILLQTFIVSQYLLYQTYIDPTLYTLYVYIASQWLLFNLFTVLYRSTIFRYILTLMHSTSDKPPEISPNQSNRQLPIPNTQRKKWFFQRISDNFYKPITRDSQRPTHNRVITDVIQTEEQQQQQLCVICQDGKPECILMPCGHGGFCRKCIHDCKLCYLCRNAVLQILLTESNNGNVIVAR